jgi:beta-phosphoglucomutase
MMRPLEGIVLDFDGVIANSERLHLRAFQEALGDTELTLTPEAYYAYYLGFDDAGVFRALAADQGMALSADVLDALVAEKGHRYEVLASNGEMRPPPSPWPLRPGP